MFCLRSLIFKFKFLLIFITTSDCFIRTNINDFRIDDLDEILKYSIIKPQIYNTRSKRSIPSIPMDNSGHINEVILTYQYNDENIKLNLHLNENILADDYFLSTQNSNGTGDLVRQTDEDEKNLCNYQGIIDGKPNSNVAISTCNGNVNGVVFDENNTFFIYSPNQLNEKSYLIKSSDLVRKGKCGVDTSLNHHHSHQVISHNELNHFNLRQKRSVIKAPFNANEASSFVEFILVIDNSVYRDFNNDIHKVHEYCKDLVNIINSIYQPLNVFIALVGVVVWTERDEISISSSSEDTLKNFMEYRKNKLLSLHPHDNAHLLTNKKFNSDVVGKAYVGTMCSSSSSGGVAVRHSKVVGSVASTIAHEMGHNFGMKHDGDVAYCSCHAKNCIMADTTNSVPIQHWSTCSKNQIVKSKTDGVYECLRNKPEKLFGFSTCGNGFVEPGEECDCGLPSFCNNECCNPHTCKLRVNSTCATGECCNLNTCQLKETGRMCRSANGECDLPEYCTGNSEYCPNNIYKQNGNVCDNNESYCYKGVCGSRNSQCQKLWGQNARSEESCYALNRQGNAYGHCGRNYLLNLYTRCYEKDISCGLLQCSNRSPMSPLQFNTEISSEYSLTHRTINRDKNGYSKLCYSAEIDTGLRSLNLGLTPNGAKCGLNKMCVNHQCVRIENEESKASCTDNCNGNGVCNSNGNCHCFEGFAPPFCKDIGRGGSIDSGPETTKVAEFDGYIYIAVFLISFVISVIAFVIYFYKKKTFENKLIRKSTKVYAETTKPIVVAKRKSQIGGITLISTTNSKLISNSTEIILNPDDDEN